MKPKWLILTVGASLLAFVGWMTWLLGPYTPRADEITAALHTTILPRFSVHGVFYKEAVDVVLQRFREVHPELRKVPIIYQVTSGQSPPPGWGSVYPNVDLEMHDIPADTALHYIASQTGMVFAVRDGEIYLCSITWTDDYVPPLTRRERCIAYLDDWYQYIRYDCLRR